MQGEPVFDMIAFITHHHKKQSVPDMNRKLLPERKDLGPKKSFDLSGPVPAKHHRVHISIIVIVAHKKIQRLRNTSRKGRNIQRCDK